MRSGRVGAPEVSIIPRIGERGWMGIRRCGSPEKPNLSRDRSRRTVRCRSPLLVVFTYNLPSSSTPVADCVLCGRSHSGAVLSSRDIRLRVKSIAPESTFLHRHRDAH
ncbi:hypothetical protein MRX96_041634 [Rhipicephalus microplus]